MPGPFVNRNFEIILKTTIMKKIFLIPTLFAFVLTLSLTSCKDKDAAVETETTESYSTETTMDTVPTPVEEMPAVNDSAAVTAPAP